MQRHLYHEMRSYHSSTICTTKTCDIILHSQKSTSNVSSTVNSDPSGLLLRLSLDGSLHAIHSILLGIKAVTRVIAMTSPYHSLKIHPTLILYALLSHVTNQKGSPWSQESWSQAPSCQDAVFSRSFGPEIPIGSSTLRDTYLIRKGNGFQLSQRLPQFLPHSTGPICKVFTETPHFTST